MSFLPDSVILAGFSGGIDLGQYIMCIISPKYNLDSMESKTEKTPAASLQVPP